MWERIIATPELLVPLGGTVQQKSLPMAAALGLPHLWGYGCPRPPAQAPSAGAGTTGTGDRSEVALAAADMANDLCQSDLGSDGLAELLSQAIPALGEFLDKAGDGTMVLAGGLGAPIGLALKVTGLALKLARPSVSPS